MTDSRKLAVAIHDVEPATFERCALIRDWLNDLGVDKATLLVIPAPDLHPFDDRRPELAVWLDERVRDGDSVAQHGFQHRQTRPAGQPRQMLARLQGGHAAEFPGLDANETERAVQAGLRVLRSAGVAPHGFVAPAYAYTGALREVLGATFDWWASVWSVHDRNGGMRAPALGLGTSGPIRRALSPPLVRAGALLPSRTIRLDLHPADFDHPRHVLALEWVIRRAHRHSPITYDDLAQTG
jgi:predicted deacetylase